MLRALIVGFLIAPSAALAEEAKVEVKKITLQIRRPSRRRHCVTGCYPRSATSNRATRPCNTSGPTARVVLEYRRLGGWDKFDFDVPARQAAARRGHNGTGPPGILSAHRHGGAPLYATGSSSRAACMASSFCCPKCRASACLPDLTSLRAPVRRLVDRNYDAAPTACRAVSRSPPALPPRGRR